MNDLVALFEAARDARPDAIALGSLADGLDYSGLDRRAGRVAAALIEAGVPRGGRVGVSLPRGEGVVVVLLGILKAGCAYVPLDPANPRPRLDAMAADAELAAMVVETGREEEWADTAPALGVDALGLPAGGPEAPASRAPRPDDLAYVMYTSGTTGRPKGVMVTHANVSSLLDACRPLFEFGPSDVWSLFHSYAFDVSVWEMWGALAHGGRLVVATPEVTRAPDRFRALLARESVTVLSQTPSAFSALVAAEEAEPCLGDALRCVVLAGEALDPRILRPWFRRLGDERPRVVNMYGITETTIHNTFRWIRSADAGATTYRSPVGRPLSHLDIELVDDDGVRVARGQTGEIVVRGAGVARGYLGGAGRAGSRFGIADDGTPTYRSGDLARWSDDGEILYEGRRDHQVQIRGFRVELGEVEAALRTQDVVAEAVVVYRDEGAGARLVAYVVPSLGVAASAAMTAAVRAEAAARLPEYMVPAWVVPLDRMPLTVNGKLDRSALPEPPGYAPETAPSVEGTLDGRLSLIWSEFLGRGGLSPSTDFFEAGGHSLMAVEVLLRVREEFGVPIALGALFEHPTLGELADEVERLLSEVEAFDL
ncbi:MAG: non-ribosomal peptide synthetase [Longimicrobiales bacterium]